MASTTSIPETQSTLALLFRAGGVLYGCDITETQEIIPLRPATRLPGAPPFVRGLINMRGTIVTVLDLGTRLDPSRAPAREGSILLVRQRERLVGLVVEEVADVRRIELEQEDGAGAGAGPMGGIVRGVAAADGGAVVVLDLDALIRQVLL